jgi:hypothetical protein
MPTPPTEADRMTLAEAFQAVFGGELPRPCVHCGVLTQERASYFTEGDTESGPYAWTEPAHDACVATAAAEADAYATAYEAYQRATLGDEAYNAAVEAEDAYHAQVEAERAALAKLAPVAGCRPAHLLAECDSCRRTATLYERVAYTLGHRGHPGAEQTAFALCATCLGSPEPGAERANLPLPAANRSRLCRCGLAMGLVDWRARRAEVHAGTAPTACPNCGAAVAYHRDGYQLGRPGSDTGWVDKTDPTARHADRTPAVCAHGNVVCGVHRG